jgi:superfamily I DNA/RNA helicase
LDTDIEELIAQVYEKYQKALQASNSLDFDDLLLLPNILFKTKPEILEKRQKRFKYILVDEAQDTN